MLIEYIQSILLIISSILIIISAIGVLSLDKDTKNVVYARIHIFGVFDIACVLAMIGLGQYLLAIIYIVFSIWNILFIEKYFNNRKRKIRDGKSKK